MYSFGGVMNNTYINQYIDNIDVFSQDISMDNKGRITIPKGFPFNIGDKIFVKYNKNERFFKLISLDLKLKQLLNTYNVMEFDKKLYLELRKSIYLETVNYSYSYKLDKYRRLLLSKKMFNLDDNCIFYSKGCLEDLYLFLDKDKRDSYSLEKEISI